MILHPTPDSISMSDTPQTHATCVLSGETLPLIDLVWTSHGFLADYLWDGLPIYSSEEGVAEIPAHLEFLFQVRDLTDVVADEDRSGYGYCAATGALVAHEDLVTTRLGDVARHVWVDGMPGPAGPGGVHTLPEYLERLLDFKGR